MLPLSKYLNGGAGGSPRQPPYDLASGVFATLHGDLGNTWQVVERHHVAHHEDLRVSGQREILIHLHPAGPIDLAAALLREQLAERRCTHPGCPDLAPTRDASLVAVGINDVDTGVIDPDDLRIELDVDADLPQLIAGGCRELVPESAEYSWCGIKQNDLRLGGVDAAEIPAQRTVRQLADLTCHLDPGRSGAHDDESQPLLLLLRVLAQLSQLEAPEDAASQLQCVIDALHAGSKLGELIIAEVRLTGTRRNDQGVVRRNGGAQRAHRGDRFGGYIDLGDSAE